MLRSKSRNNAVWLLPACLGLGERKTPFHLVELGAGDGLSLIADYSERESLYSEAGEPLPGPDGYARSPYPILSRTGLDPRPAQTLDALYAALSREPAGPKLKACGWEQMPENIARDIPAREHEGLLIYNMRREAGLDDAALARIMLSWGEAAFWAEFEPGPGLLQVRRLVGGVLQSSCLAGVDAQGRFRLRKGWNFLQPISHVPSPRFTFEEPPRQLEPGTYKAGRKAPGP